METETLASLLGSARVRLRELQSQLGNLRASQREIDAQIQTLSSEAGHLEAILQAHGEPDQTRNSLVTESVDVRDLVFDLLSTKGPLHYREIEKELRDQRKYVAGGKDPANTLLSRFFSDPRLSRVSRGVYSVRKKAGIKVTVEGERDKK